MDGQGANYDATNRARSNYKFVLHPMIYLTFPTGYKHRICVFTNGVFSYYTDWSNDTEVSLANLIPNSQNENYYYFRLLIGKIDDSVLSYVPDVIAHTQPVAKNDKYITSDEVQCIKGYACSRTPYALNGYVVSAPIPVKANTPYKSVAIRNYYYLNENCEYINNGSSGGNSQVSIPSNGYIVYCWRES